MSGIRSYVSGMSLVLLCVCILLAGWLYRQWHVDIAEQYLNNDSLEKADPGEYEMDSVPAFQATPFASLSEIFERPLFTEGRIPAEKPDKNTNTATKAVPLKLKLEGVVISPESKVAIISDLQTKELLRLSQGMSHANWKVTAVSEESVTIQQGANEITLQLEIDEAAGSLPGKPRAPFKLPNKRPGVRR